MNELLIAKGLLLKVGTAVDATLVAASSSTKNKDKARDREMHSSKKGEQMYFGMKAQIGGMPTLCPYRSLVAQFSVSGNRCTSRRAILR